MSAVTPKAPDHGSLPPLASRFVDVARLPWDASERHPGVETKTLLVDRSSGLLTMLLRMAPGAKLPDHEHVLIEQTYVLEGSLVCGEGVCRAGEFVWRPAGSRHEAWAGPEGGLMLGMFQMPNRFFEPDGRSVDFLGNDWERTWGEALARAEHARFEPAAS
jgi:anti-sigma factor ChrR (cupin superfamily)